MSDLDTLLDLTLDDLQDLPSYQPFPAGAHRVTASMAVKDMNGATAVEVTFTLLETIEQADDQATPAKPGDTANTLCMLANEFGQGNLKMLAAPIAAALSLSKLGDVVEQCRDIECVIRTTLRKDKKDPDKVYMSVKELLVV